jgi:hypothetical protein
MTPLPASRPSVERAGSGFLRVWETTGLGCPFLGPCALLSGVRAGRGVDLGCRMAGKWLCVDSGALSVFGAVLDASEPFSFAGGRAKKYTSRERCRHAQAQVAAALHICGLALAAAFAFAIVCGAAPPRARQTLPPSIAGRWYRCPCACFAPYHCAGTAMRDRTRPTISAAGWHVCLDVPERLLGWGQRRPGGRSGRWPMGESRCATDTPNCSGF